MPFEYSCFISYRNAKQPLGEAFVDELEAALSSELELLTNKPVYVDKSRLQGGDRFNPALQEALCKSVCMLMVYTPMYFDPCGTYCAREYRAMVRLEQERFEMLGDAVDATHGLIIPVVFRGRKFLPKEISDHRHYHDFSDFLLIGEQMARHPTYAPQIKEIAAYIHDRCTALEQLADMYNDCTEFLFPSDADIREWLAEVAPPAMRFPGVN